MTSFDFALKTLTLGTGGIFHYYSLEELEKAGFGSFARLPYSVKVLIESIVRHQGHPAFREEHVRSLAGWTPDGRKNRLPVPARADPAAGFHRRSLRGRPRRAPQRHGPRRKEIPGRSSRRFPSTS